MTTIEKSAKRLGDGSVEVELGAIAARSWSPGVRLKPELEEYRSYVPLIAAVLLSTIADATREAFDSAQASVYQPPLFTRLVNGLVRVEGETPLSITMIFARCLQERITAMEPAADLGTILAIAHAIARAVSEKLDREDEEAARTEDVARRVNALSAPPNPRLPSDATTAN